MSKPLKAHGTKYGPHRLEGWSDRELRAAVDALGPFRPPAHFRHGTVFDSVTPRGIPDEVRDGPVCRSRRRWTSGFVILGLIFLTANFTTFIREAKFFVLVLHGLPYVGGAIFIAGAARLLWFSRCTGVLKYVRDGEPTIARILTIGSVVCDRDKPITRKRSVVDDELAAVPTVAPGEEVTNIRFACGAEYIDPDTKGHVFTTFYSNRWMPLGSTKNCDLSVEPGDYVTVVGFPQRFVHTARLWGFLNLTDEGVLTRRGGRPFVPDAARTVAGLFASAAVLLVFVLPLFIYIASRFEPQGEAPAQWIIGIAVGVAIMVALSLVLVFRTSLLEGSRTETAGVVFLFAMMGAIGGFFGTNVVNATLDSSPSAYRDIETTEYLQTTEHPAFIRYYTIKFHGVGTAVGGDFYANPRLIDAFQQTELGVAELGSGTLGMKWIRALHPMMLEPIDDAVPANTTTVTLSFEDEGKPLQVILVPVIRGSEGEHLPVSDRLLERLRRKLETGSVRATLTRGAAAQIPAP